jgi:hypothetical protein
MEIVSVGNDACGISTAAQDARNNDAISPMAA